MECQTYLKHESDALKAQLIELKNLINTIGNQTRSDIIKH